MKSELQEKHHLWHYTGIPTTPAERAAKRTNNKLLPIVLRSEAFD